MPHSRVILLIDDNSDDRLLIRRAFMKCGIINPVLEVSSGAEAIAYLNGDGKFADRGKHPFPGILLLDLNMPGVDGFDVLEWVRNKAGVQGLLIIVLSRLDELKKVNRAYDLGANSFLTKPGDERELEGLITGFRDFWLLRNKAPELRRRVYGGSLRRLTPWPMKGEQEAVTNLNSKPLNERSLV